MVVDGVVMQSNGSLRSSERGLKYGNNIMAGHCVNVAPFVGAWIEMLTCLLKQILHSSRSVRRSVD